MQGCEVGDPAVAHGALDLAQRLVEVVAQLAGVGHVAAPPLLEGESGGRRLAVVALPVARLDVPSPQYSLTVLWDHPAPPAAAASRACQPTPACGIGPGRCDTDSILLILIVALQ